MSRVITLLTDFGTTDSYVAEVKGRLLSLAPDAQLVDISHDIPPGDVAAGAYVLGRAWRAFPAGTTHLAVVDPGVGTARRALAVTAAGHGFVGPDNGLLMSAIDQGDAAIFVLPVPPGASATFHGRDLFAPAAAAIAMGATLASLGEPVPDPVRLPFKSPRETLEGLVGSVVHVDRFGTLITNIGADLLGKRRTVRLGEHRIPIRATFADVASGELVAFIGSGGTLEVAVRDGSAAKLLQMQRGAEISAAS